MLISEQETTEISVLSLGGIVISKAVKIGGNKLDDCIISNVRNAYNLVIGSKTAENLKKQLGSAVPVSETFAPLALEGMFYQVFL